MKSLDQIAAELQGHDPQDMPVDVVSDFLQRLVQPVTEVETVGIFAALDRVLACDVVAPLSVPPHDNSAMDGYAFDGRQLQDGAPLALRTVGKAFAGQAWRGMVGAGECIKIMTGAILPAGLDTVVPQELVQELVQAGDAGDTREAGAANAAAEISTIVVPAGVLRAGANRRLKGEDLMAGSVALAQGARLTPAALGLLASLGLERVVVFRRLRVAFFSTGSEILSLGEAPREGAVYDSNRYTLFGLLTRLGVEVVDLGTVRDEPAQLEAALRSAARQADATITSGGVSTGEADHTRTLLQQLGDVAFWRIAMRPGRPMAAGRIHSGGLQDKTASNAHAESAGSYQKRSKETTTAEAAKGAEGAQGSVLFALPGNPVAVMVAFLALVRPALLRMMGSTQAPPPLLRARSAETLRKKPGRTEYQRGVVSTAPDGALEVRTTGNQGSGVLSSMVQAHGLIVLPHAQGNVAAGETVDVMLFDGAI